jgi:protein-disulfide isomerase
MHNRAGPAAEAANCANEQGKFWEYHDKLFANQKALADGDLKMYASDLGLDEAAFSTCYDSGKYRADVKKDQAEGAAVGVSGTPAFFVNGRFLSGAQPFEAFKKIIDEELAR